DRAESRLLRTHTAHAYWKAILHHWGCWQNSGSVAVARRRHVLGFISPFPLVKNRDRKSTRLNSSHLVISYAVFCLKKKNSQPYRHRGACDRSCATGIGATSLPKDCRGAVNTVASDAPPLVDAV